MQTNLRITIAALAIALALSGCTRSSSPSAASSAELAPTPAAPAAGKVAVYLTTGDLRQTLARQADLAFTNTGNTSGTAVTIDAAYVEKHVGDLSRNTDLSRFIL